MSIPWPTTFPPAFAERMALRTAAPQPASGVPTLDSSERRKLRKASEEFEAILIAEWWKSASTGIAGLSEEDEGGLQAFRDFSQQAMSLALAQAGGLGLGRILCERLAPALPATAPAAPAKINDFQSD